MAEHEFKVNEQAYQMMSVEDIREHPQNPNEGSDAAVQESIEANDFFGAVLVQKSTGYLLAGHTTRRAAIASGAKQIPVIVIDVDDERALRILLADNQTARAAVMNDERLSSLLQQLKDTSGSLRGTGYTEGDLSKLLDSLKVPDFQPIDEAQQARLDVRKKLICPECGHEFETK